MSAVIRSTLRISAAVLLMAAPLYVLWHYSGMKGLPSMVLSCLLIVPGVLVMQWASKPR